MFSPTATTRQLSTAGERRDTLVDAAVHTFAQRGFHATPTTEIARAAGISQAYLFRLFPTKTELFVAAMERATERKAQTFAAAAASAKAAGEDPLEAMGLAYLELVERDRDVLLIQFHSNAAAAGEPEIGAAARDGWRRLVELVQRESGAPEAEIKRFFATGMLINVVVAIGAHEVDEMWAQTLCGKPDDA